MPPKHMICQQRWWNDIQAVLKHKAKEATFMLHNELT